MTVIGTMAVVETADQTNNKAKVERDSWPQWRIDLLRRYLLEGQTSTQISILLGCSRNAVLGKKWRLNLPGRPRHLPTATNEAQLRARRARRAAKEREKRRNGDYSPRRKKPTRPADIYMTSTGKIASLGVTLDKLTWNGTHPTNCRAIISPDGAANILYCGLPNWEGESYCSGHCRRFFNKFNPDGNIARKGPSSVLIQSRINS